MSRRFFFGLAVAPLAAAIAAKLPGDYARGFLFSGLHTDETLVTLCAPGGSGLRVGDEVRLSNFPGELNGDYVLLKIEREMLTFRETLRFTPRR